MALTPIDETHALQIQAGTIGRKAGHAFEDRITECINSISFPVSFDDHSTKHVLVGEPGLVLLKYIAGVHGQNTIESAVALSTGALATSEEGKKWLEVNGVPVKRCKSDIILTVRFSGQAEDLTIGVSTKQCNNRTPTNAQLFFTTARGFASLLNSNDIYVSDEAVNSLRQFCGDTGFRPLDAPELHAERLCDPRRFFWEEIEENGRAEWEALFKTKQDEITRLLLQKAYLEDPFSPDVVLHKTKKADSC